MNELQGLLTGWISNFAAVLPVGFAFGAGMVSAVNPCGFAMLPAYLSLYLGSDEDDFRKRSLVLRVLRALLIGTVVSLGFILLFGLAGIVVSAGGNAILGIMPWVGAVMGVALILMGVWMFAGRSLYTGVFERVAERVGNPKAMGIRSFFFFGLAYGLASLSCTLPVFLAVVGSSITAGSFASGAVQFLGYGLGMASVLLTLTLALAFFKQGMVLWFRKSVAYVQTASAVLLVVAGGYIIYYWWPDLTA
jgi:cytochrome c-type biogenesis protein